MKAWEVSNNNTISSVSQNPGEESEQRKSELIEVMQELESQ